MNKASAEAARPRRGSLKGSRGSGPQGAGVSVSNSVSVASVPMNYFNRLARLPYDNQRNAAYQAAESRRLAEKEAAAKAKADVLQQFGLLIENAKKISKDKTDARIQREMQKKINRLNKELIVPNIRLIALQRIQNEIASLEKQLEKQSA